MKKVINVLVLFLLCLTFSINSVGAKSYIKDLFQYEEKLEVKEELEGTSFLLGTKVNIEKKINGVGFIAGETITIKDIQEYLFVAGTKVNYEADTEKDLFLMAEEANLNGKVIRDTYVLGTDVSMDGEYNRNVYIAGSTVELKGTYKGNVTINATDIEISDEVTINGTLRYNEDATIEGINKDIKTKTYKVTANDISFVDYIVSALNSYVNILMVALLLVFICESIFKKSLNQTKNNNIFSLVIKGFIILIGVPIIAVMSLLTGALTSLGIIGGILYGILIYISHIFTGYYLAHKLDKHYFKKNLNSYKLMIIGLLIIKLLSIVPIIGEFVSLFSMLLGLGIVGNMIIELKAKK